jgi:hypothetical protein
MNVESPYVATSEQLRNNLQSPIAQTPPMSISDNNRADVDDDIINVAYEEIRRSVSPQVAGYIFQPREDKVSPTNSNLTGVGWTLNRILNISMTDHDLINLSDKSVGTLDNIATSLWNFGKSQYLDYCAHIGEVLLARANLATPRNAMELRYLDMLRRNLLAIYIRIGKVTECETLLTEFIAETDARRPGDPIGTGYRSRLGRVLSRQGRHILAEEICWQAMISLRFAQGLGYWLTWEAYGGLQIVLQNQGRFDDGLRLMTSLYVDVYLTMSAQLLPGLRASLELCEGSIVGWMTESKLQRLVRDRFLCHGPLDIGERITLILDTVIRERWMEEEKLETLPEIVKDLQDKMGLTGPEILATFALLIALRIQAVRPLESASLRQEALRAVEDLKSTKYLVPLWIFTHMNTTRVLTEDFNWRVAEHDLLQLLEGVVIDRGDPTEAASFGLFEDLDSSKSTLPVANSPTIHWSTSPKGSESSVVIPAATGPASFSETSTGTLGFYGDTTMSSAAFSTTLVPSRPQLTSGSVESLAPARLDHANPRASSSVMSWNAEPSFSQPRPLAEGHQLSDDDQSRNRFSPPFTFSRPLSSIQGYQPFVDAPPQNRFSPTMMSTPTPSFTFSLPQTPNPSSMSPPPRPGEASSDAAPSSVLAGRPDFPTSPNFFGLTQSPLPASPYQASGSSPWT